MTADVVLGQRLLDEQQVEGVQGGQLARLRQGVGRVRVHLQQDVAEPLANRAYRLDVPALLDLQLDPLVALGQVAVHGVEQLRHRLHDAHGDAAGDPGPGGAQVLSQRQAGRPEFGVQHGGLQRGLGHQVPLEPAERRSHRGRARVVERR